MRRVIQLTAWLMFLALLPATAGAQDQVTINQVTGIEVAEQEEGTAITILGNRAPTFSVYQLNEPARLFIDFSNTELSGDVTNWTVRNGLVDDVLALQYQDDLSLVTRVVVTLETDEPDYDVQTEGHNVVLTLTGLTDSAAIASAGGAERTDVVLGEYESALRALQGYQTELSSQQDELVRLSQSSNESQQQVSALRDELSTLREQLAQRDTAIREAAEREAELRNRVAGIESTGGNQSELEVALREREAQSYTLRSLEAEYDGLLNDASETSDELSEAELRLADAAERRRDAQERAAQSESSMEDLVATIESMQAEADRREALLIERRVALEQLENEVSQVAQREQEQRERAEALAGQVTEVEHELAEARLGEQGAQDAMGALETRSQQLESELEELTALAGQRGDRARLQSELAEVRDQLALVQNEVSAAIEHRQAAEREAVAAELAHRQELERFEEAAADREAVASEAAAARNELEQTESLLAQRQDERRRVQRELQQAMLEREGLNAQLEELAANQLEQESALIDGRREHAALVAETAELAETRARTRREVEDAQAEQAEAQRALSALEQERRGVQSELSTLADRRSQMEAELAAMERQLAELDGEEGVIATDASHAPRIASPANAEITDLRFEQIDGVDRVVLEMEGTGAEVRSLPWVDGRASLLVSGATLPEHLRRTLDTRAFEGPIQFVSAYDDAEGVHVVAEIAEAASEILSEGEEAVSWEFSSVSADWDREPSELDGYNSQEESTTAPPIQRPTGISYTIGERDRPLLTPRLSRRYRVTIDVVNVGIQDVLRVFSDQGDVNIIAGGDIGGTITLRLRGVPLDEAFALILQSQQLGFEQRGNIIRVAPLATFEAERQRQIDDIARNFSLEPLQVRLRPVSYAEGSAIIGHISDLLSSRGNVAFDERTHMLIMKDVAANLNAAEQLIDALDTQTPQILIEARIVQTGESFSRGFGIQWGGDTLFSPANGNATGLLFPSTIGIMGGAGNSPADGTSPTPNYAVNVPGPGTGAIGFHFGSLGQAVNLNLRLSAAEQSGTAKVVSAPRILTLDGMSATISSGVSIPVQSTGAAGANVTFVNANLSLSVTPTVTPDGFVHLQLSITKNEPDFARTGANGDPTIVTRSTNTQLLVRDGETSVIGGIFEHVTGSDQNAVPIFADIPILGALFHDYQFTDERSETLVFVTPRIVNRDVSLTNYTPGGVFMTPED